MDREKILQIKGMLTELEQFKENSNEITIVSKDNILRVDGEVMAAMMSAAIIVLENQLDIAKFGKPSDNLEDSREFKAARALEDAINSFSFNPDRFAEANDIWENFDSSLHHLGNLSQIVIFCDNLFQIRLCHLIEGIKIHGFDIFAVHPF